MESLNIKQKIIFITIISFMIIVIAYYFFNRSKKEEYENSYIIEEQENTYKNEKEEEMIDEESTTEKQKPLDTIVIHIAGEVNNEGIIYLEKGQRISDAIEKAGGVTRPGGSYKSKFGISCIRWTKDIHSQY